MNELIKIERYAKILQYGKRDTFKIKEGEVTVEEKVDGSQFRIFCNGYDRKFGSKSVDYTEERTPDSMFLVAILNATGLLKDINFEKPTMIYCEYLSKTKQNTLNYGRVPKNNLMIFDVKVEDKWLNWSDKKKFADTYDFDCIPRLWQGDGKDLTFELIESLIKQKSTLGDVIVEGVVMKNYEQLHTVEYLLGMPIMIKYVRDSFKEINTKNWKGKNKKGFMENMIEKYKSTNRWQKAIQHCNERGQLEGEMKDVPDVLREIISDLETEEGETIKKELYDFFWKEIKKGVVRGFPEYYRGTLLKEVLDDDIKEIKDMMKV